MNTKEYREKLKIDPEKYKIYLKKARERSKKRYNKIKSDLIIFQEYRQKGLEYSRKRYHNPEKAELIGKNTEYARRYRQKLKETDPEKYEKIFLEKAKKYWEKKNKKEV